METVRFDRLTRTFSHLLSRRGLAGVLGLSVLGLPSLTEAKKRKKKKKKIKRNEFGCVDVGKFCKNGGQCCSGICQGKKGKKKCKAHDASTCQAGQTIGDCGGVDVECTSSAGEPGQCFTTTGNAGYCFVSGDCFPCKKDADCVPICGAQAACVVCAAECGARGGTACVAPIEDSCTFPM